MATVTYTAKISPQGQITIPKKLREQLRQGSTHSFIRLRYAASNTLDINPEPAIVKFFGSLQPKQPQASATEVIQSMRAHTQKRQEDLSNIIDA